MSILIVKTCLTVYDLISFIKIVNSVGDITQPYSGLRRKINRNTKNKTVLSECMRYEVKYPVFNNKFTNLGEGNVSNASCIIY